MHHHHPLIIIHPKVLKTQDFISTSILSISRYSHLLNLLELERKAGVFFVLCVK